MIYKIHMSRGDDIKIDEEDLVKIQENIGEKLIRIKQGIINPSFMISIVPTDEKEFRVENIIERKGDRIAIVGQKEVKVLADKMNIKNNLLNDGN